MPIKLNDFDLPQDRAWLQLRHPDTDELLFEEGTEVPIRIEVLSSDSKEYRRREREINRKLTQTRRRVDVNDFQLERAIAATNSWDPPGAFLNAKGEPLNVADADHIRQLYEAFPRWMNAVLAFADERSNYRGN